MQENNSLPLAVSLMDVFSLASLCYRLQFHASVQKGADSLCLKAQPCSFEIHKDDHGNTNVKQLFIVPTGSHAGQYHAFKYKIFKNIIISCKSARGRRGSCLQPDLALIAASHLITFGSLSSKLRSDLYVNTQVGLANNITVSKLKPMSPTKGPQAVIWNQPLWLFQNFSSVNLSVTFSNVVHLSYTIAQKQALCNIQCELIEYLSNTYSGVDRFLVICNKLRAS